jgi:hypothetical protein
MPKSSNHTEVSVHCCHDKYIGASSRTLLSDLVHDGGGGGGGGGDGNDDKKENNEDSGKLNHSYILMY